MQMILIIGKVRQVSMTSGMGGQHTRSTERCPQGRQGGEIGAGEEGGRAALMAFMATPP